MSDKNFIRYKTPTQQKCAMCGIRPAYKRKISSKNTIYSGYTYNPDLCVSCNEMNFQKDFIKRKYENSEDISLDELKILPIYIAFDDKDKDMATYLAGKVSKYENTNQKDHTFS